MKILIVEDNRNIRENIAFLLKKNNYLCVTASNGKEALEKVFETNFDLIILDINMPILNGKEFLIKIREKKVNSGVIALTSNSMLEDKLELFDLGVDDYMTKPFEIDELLARIKSILKRGNKEILEETKELGDICINYSSKKIFLKGEEISLTFKQYLILEFLSKNFGYPQTKIKIMEYVWGEAEENLEFDSTTLESHIYSLRKKFGKNFIKTIKGIGYIIE